MSELLQQIIPLVPAYAWPIIIVVLGGMFIYRKIGNERKITAEKRDTEHENLETRVILLERELEAIKSLDLSTKLAQIQTDLQWIKENMKK
jgi:putative Mn2+ efflux pump MntP